VLLALDDFEEWLAAEAMAWPQAWRENLCYNWLLREMCTSPDDKRKIKTKWVEEAKAQFHVTGREFERAWSSAIKETAALIFHVFQFYFLRDLLRQPLQNS
jgi:hypothetical protein